MAKDDEEEMTLAEARANLSINRHALEKELSDQPDLFARVSTRAVTYASLRDFAKYRLGVIEAEASNEVRQAFAEEGSKVTEGAIKEEVTQHVGLRKATRSYLEVKKEADLWQVLRDAYEQRGRMIRDLCGLYVAGYYQHSAVRGDTESGKNASAQYARKRLNDVRKPLPSLKERT